MTRSQCILTSVIILSYSISAYAADQLVRLRPFADGVDYAFLRPDGWTVVQGAEPAVLSQEPKLIIVAAIRSPDETIKGEIKFVAKDASAIGKDVADHIQEFFIDYDQQVLHARLTRRLIVGGDQHSGVYRMQYIDDKNHTLIEQICNGGVGAVSITIDIPPNNSLGPTALKILNHSKCDIKSR